MPAASFQQQRTVTCVDSSIDSTTILFRLPLQNAGHRPPPCPAFPISSLPGGVRKLSRPALRLPNRQGVHRAVQQNAPPQASGPLIGPGHHRPGDQILHHDHQITHIPALREKGPHMDQGEKQAGNHIRRAPAVLPEIPEHISPEKRLLHHGGQKTTIRIVLRGEVPSRVRIA